MDKAKEPTTTQTTGQQDFKLIGIVITFLILGIGIVYFLALGTGNEPKQTDVAQLAQLTPSPTESDTVNPVVKVPFDYIVEDISDSEIVVNGDLGLMHLPNDPAQVTVRKMEQAGSYANAKISDLSIGQRVELEIKPGEFAIIYIK